MVIKHEGEQDGKNRCSQQEETSVAFHGPQIGLTSCLLGSEAHLPFHVVGLPMLTCLGDKRSHIKTKAPERFRGLLSGALGPRSASRQNRKPESLRNLAIDGLDLITS